MASELRHRCCDPHRSSQQTRKHASANDSIEDWIRFRCLAMTDEPMDESEVIDEADKAESNAPEIMMARWNACA